ncbi:hypothetical protein [Dyadobacter sandarakinus]|uniref:OmpA family protein n=1 Tax=Dyadobacter sandarakinus TaxID=2747268 RepID=A0ABX7I770_9BACT|nr:hypothetical protein [Dyadobacter sandarakinus]QRR01573.1 hypothetical protein HWI92_11990 [Dyadobacter sandarakinus]
MYRTRVLWWILLIFWMSGSLYWHVFKIEHFYFNAEAQQTSTDSTPVYNNLSINGENGFKLVSRGEISFAKSDDSANFAPVVKELDSLAIYLAVNPSSLVTITGSFHPDEINPTLFRNLGLARAVSVRRFFLRRRLPDSIFTLRSRLIPEPANKLDSIHGGIEIQVADTTSSNTP